MKQAAEVIQKLLGIQINNAIRSDLKRTQQTLNAIMRFHLETRQIVDRGINEKNFGIWEELTANQVEARAPNSG